MVVAAAQGDRKAAGEYFTKNLSYLMVLARRISGGVMDPEDLLSESFLRLLEQWSIGSGPTQNVNAYLAVIMRNRVKDELKSPRSRVRVLDQSEDIVDPTAQDMTHVEVRNEVHLVRKALENLPQDQSKVLLAMTVLGEKPRNLEKELGRPAGAISSLHRRAKLSLRKEVFRLVLGGDAPSPCIEAINRVPEKFPDLPSQYVGDIENHFEGCERCRRAWTRFGRLAMAFGILPLATAGGLVFGPATEVQAASLIHGAETGQYGQSSAPQDLTQSEVLERGGSASSEHPTRSLTARQSGKQPLQAGGFLVVLRQYGTGGLIAVAGLLAMAIGVVTLIMTSPTPTASFSVTPVEGTLRSNDFRVDFSVSEKSWRIQTLTLEAAQEVEQIKSPPGWECSLQGNAARCVTNVVNSEGGNFTVKRRNTSSDSRLIFLISAETGSGRNILGTVELSE
nr:sigma-70 family RNA polymerase sigma factor [Leucobacter chinensis]